MMFKGKRSWSVILCLALCLAAFPVPRAMAATPPGFGDSEILPMMEYIYDADLDFAISNGTAYMYAFVNGHSAKATKCEVTVELQERGFLFWNTVESWTVTENARRAEVDVTHAVTSGEEYRMVATVTVWSGTASETKTLTSGGIEA